MFRFETCNMCLPPHSMYQLRIIQGCWEAPLRRLLVSSKIRIVPRHFWVFCPGIVLHYNARALWFIVTWAVHQHKFRANSCNHRRRIHASNECSPQRRHVRLTHLLAVPGGKKSETGRKLIVRYYTRKPIALASKEINTGQRRLGVGSR